MPRFMAAIKFALILLLFGCQSANNLPPVTATPQSPPSSETESSFNPDSAAHSAIAQFVQALNEDNPNAIAEYLQRGEESIDFAKAALNDYKIYFQGEKIARHERVGTHPTMPDAVQYKIYSTSGIHKKIDVIYQRNILRIDDQFLSYSYRAKHLLDNFVENIQQENAQELALTLTPDDVPYPLSYAQSAIKRYQTAFDTQTLKYRFAQLEAEKNQFLYILYGSRQGKSVEHQVNITYGDSLVSLKDPFTPACEPPTCPANL